MIATAIITIIIILSAGLFTYVAYKVIINPDKMTSELNFIPTAYEWFVGGDKYGSYFLKDQLGDLNAFDEISIVRTHIYEIRNKNYPDIMLEYSDAGYGDARPVVKGKRIYSHDQAKKLRQAVIPYHIFEKLRIQEIERKLKEEEDNNKLINEALGGKK